MIATALRRLAAAGLLRPAHQGIPGVRGASSLRRPPPPARRGCRSERRPGGGGDGDRRNARRGPRAGVRRGVGDAFGGGERRPRGRAACLTGADTQAGHAERRRIERDLHDSTQQRLVVAANSPHARRRTARGLGRARLLGRLGADVEHAIEELRAVAHGIYPAVLGDRGVGAAVRAVARSSAMPIRIERRRRGRRSEAVETTVYFCCLECLQNTAKHAGPGPSPRFASSKTTAT